MNSALGRIFRRRGGEGVVEVPIGGQEGRGKDGAGW